MSSIPGPSSLSLTFSSKSKIPSRDILGDIHKIVSDEANGFVILLFVFSDLFIGEVVHIGNITLCERFIYRV